jgi:hypothetical protein
MFYLSLIFPVALSFLLCQLNFDISPLVKNWKNEIFLFLTDASEIASIDGAEVV